MILHAHQLAKAGFIVTIYLPDTDVLLLALRRSDELLGRHARIIIGTGENRRKILLRPILDQLGAQKAKCELACAHGL